MPPHLLKSILLPLIIFVAAHLLAFAWRALPPASKNTGSDTRWQSLQPSAATPDVRNSLLAGNHWGERQIPENAETAQTADTPEATVAALSQHIQRQLQGIIRRGDWVLLFVNPQAPAPVAADAKDQAATPPALPLELRSGDRLPDTAWHIGHIWPDRIQLLQDGHEPLIVPLYPLAASVPES